MNQQLVHINSYENIILENIYKNAKLAQKLFWRYFFTQNQGGQHENKQGKRS